MHEKLTEFLLSIGFVRNNRYPRAQTNFHSFTHSDGWFVELTVLNDSSGEMLVIARARPVLTVNFTSAGPVEGKVNVLHLEGYLLLYILSYQVEEFSWKWIQDIVQQPFLKTDSTLPL